MNKLVRLKMLWQERFNDKTTNHPIYRKKQLHNSNNKKIEWIVVKGIKRKNCTVGNDGNYYYSLHIKCMIKDDYSFYHEEEVLDRYAIFIDSKLLEEGAYTKASGDERYTEQPIAMEDIEQRFSYDRRAAVQYAERWWNDVNPAYNYFEDNDCTNYISQCLRAGGAPMTGAPDRSKGWWYSGSSWSYSWSVAHSFRWYMSSRGNTFQAKLIDSPTELLPGDIICYDFQGDGRWDHNTIVVAKDSENMPLVNAHTNNSRHRYWTYQDSAAWTPQCQYRFFRIGGN
ncbi:amidase domain-containing protein [Gracilibacillus xinjiangensis]|uniref:Amidase domain-containing protein n=1 Tax=Gracilibacillus xinjiangensis TaxID=1193282 RepID=A0ABV8WPU8_9BACI